MIAQIITAGTISYSNELNQGHSSTNSTCCRSRRNRKLINFKKHFLIGEKMKGGKTDLTHS